MTQATDAGFVVGRFYKMVKGKGGTPAGTVLQFDRDDDTECPYFKDKSGETFAPWLCNMSNVAVPGWVQASDTSAVKAGFVVGKKYVLGDVNGESYNGLEGFALGSLVIFSCDDGSRMPEFTSVVTGKTHWLHLSDLREDDGSTVVPKEGVVILTPSQLAGLKVGDYVRSADTDIVEAGTILRLCFDDKTDIPRFTNVKSGDEVYLHVSNVEKITTPVEEVAGDGVLTVTFYTAALQDAYRAAFPPPRKAFRITGNTNGSKFQVGDVVYKTSDSPTTETQNMTTDILKYDRESRGWVRFDEMEAI